MLVPRVAIVGESFCFLGSLVSVSSLFLPFLVGTSRAAVQAFQLPGTVANVGKSVGGEQARSDAGAENSLHNRWRRVRIVRGFLFFSRARPRKAWGRTGNMPRRPNFIRTCARQAVWMYPSLFQVMHRDLAGFEQLSAPSPHAKHTQ